jgi:hypothetical protein
LLDVSRLKLNTVEFLIWNTAGKGAKGIPHGGYSIKQKLNKKLFFPIKHSG